MFTTKNITILIKRILEDEFQKRGLSQYQKHDISSTLDRRKSSVDNFDGINDAIQAIVKKPQIIRGGKVLANEPPTMDVVVEEIECITNGKHLRTQNVINAEVPFNDESTVWFVQLDEFAQLKFRSYPSENYINLGKIVIPSKHTMRICQDKDFDDPSSLDGYIVSPSDPYFINTPRISEREMAKLKWILGERIVGEIVVSDKLAVKNALGTVEMTSRAINVYDGDGYKYATFGKDHLNRAGVFFYDEYGVELSRYSRQDARVGNILITHNTLESTNYASGSTGFMINKAGNSEFSNVVIRGDLYIPYNSIIGYESGTNIYDLIRRYHVESNYKVSDGDIITFSTLDIDDFIHAPDVYFSFNYVPCYKAQYSGSDQSLRLRAINITPSQFEVDAELFIEETGAYIQTVFTGANLTPKSGVEYNVNSGTEIQSADAFQSQDGASGSEVIFRIKGKAPTKTWTVNPRGVPWSYYQGSHTVRCWIGHSGGSITTGSYIDQTLSYQTDGTWKSWDIFVTHPSGTLLDWDCKMDFYAKSVAPTATGYELTDFRIEKLTYQAYQGTIVPLDDILVDIEILEK